MHLRTCVPALARVWQKRVFDCPFSARVHTSLYTLAQFTGAPMLCCHCLYTACPSPLHTIAACLPVWYDTPLIYRCTHSGDMTFKVLPQCLYMIAPYRCIHPLPLYTPLTFVYTPYLCMSLQHGVHAGYDCGLFATTIPLIYCYRRPSDGWVGQLPVCYNAG
jgi:hypothetical protein